MTSKSYQLGLDAGKRGSWFHETLDRYRSDEVLNSTDDILDFYSGYWGDLFEVVYKNGRISLINNK